MQGMAAFLCRDGISAMSGRESGAQDCMLTAWQQHDWHADCKVRGMELMESDGRLFERVATGK
jgi:hypothetical protein